MHYALKYGHSFSVEEYECDCYTTDGYPDDKCPHPTRKRQAYLDDLTDAQLQFLFIGKQEREAMKQEKEEEQIEKQRMKQQM